MISYELPKADGLLNEKNKERHKTLCLNVSNAFMTLVYRTNLFTRLTFDAGGFWDPTVFNMLLMMAAGAPHAGGLPHDVQLPANSPSALDLSP